MATRRSRKKRAPVVYVTGKGGSGKSFIAEALAGAAVARELRTALVTAPVEASRRAPARPPEGCALFRWSADEALARLLRSTVRFGFIANRLLDSSTFSAVADAAPGIADIAFLHLLDEVATDRSEEAAYDLVIVDAQASGHSATLLKAPTFVGALAFGPAASVVGRTRDLVTDPARFRPLIVCLPEELAVVETLSLVDNLRDDDIVEPTVAANATYPAPGNEPQLRWLREHPAGRDAEIYLGRYDRQAELLARLRAAVPAVCEIPRSFPPAANGRPGAAEDDFETPERAVETLLDRVLERPKKRRRARKKTSGKSASGAARRGTKPATREGAPST